MKGRKKDDNNNAGSAFVDRIDTILTLMGKKRQDLCDQTHITQQSISNWKKLNGLPSADTAIEIAKYLKVDTGWLINGTISLEISDNSKPEAIYNRIYKKLRSETELPYPDYHAHDDSDYKKIHSPLNDIVDHITLTNWRENRSIPDSYSLAKISERLHKSLNYISTGSDEPVYKLSTESGKKIEETDYEDFCAFKKVQTLFWNYERLYTPDKKLVKDLIVRLFRLRHLAEGTDYDIKYARMHPGEGNRQRNPNVSDEEYYSEDYNPEQ